MRIKNQYNKSLTSVHLHPCGYYSNLTLTPSRLSGKAKGKVKQILIIILLISAGFTLKSQEIEQKHELRLLARPLPDSIILRWAPATYQFWLNGNQYGYHVTRTTLIRNGKYVKESTLRLTKKPLKPRPLAEWERLADKDDYAGVAAQAIYGDGFDIETEGGESSIINIINKATEQENSFGFALLAADQSQDVARYSGLWLTDKEVKAGEKYLYRVFPAGVAEGMIADTAVFFTSVDEYMPLPAPINVKVEESDKMVTLTWDKEYQKEFFNSFWIERSGNKGKIFKRLNDAPLVNTTPEGHDEANFHFYVDTLPDNETTYQYRVIGISVFGELSPPSAFVKAKGVYKITSVPRLTVNTGVQEQTVQLSWDFPNVKKEKIDGFRIYRSDKFDEGYELLTDNISPVRMHYDDTLPLMNGYYRIQAFNHGFEGPQSIPKMVQLIDSVPPSVPVGLEAEVDTSGVVRLKWKANKERDIFGYRVFRANHYREEFSQLTKKAVKTNAYSDTINIKTLTKEIYYKVVAVDQRQNKSDFSGVLKVERPDIVPPASPVIKKAESTDSGISLQWYTSPSKDVEKQLLYRNRKGSHEWILVSSFDPDSTQTTDIPPLSGEIYRYLLIAVDKAGNESKPAKPVAVKYNEPLIKEIWIIPKVRFYKKKGNVALTWDAPHYKVGRYMIYRKTQKEEWELIKVVDGFTKSLMLKETALKQYKILCRKS